MAKVLNKTRDQILGFESCINKRKISLDFNDDGDPERYVSGIEIVVPIECTDFEIAMAKQWCEQVQEFFQSLGIDRTIRRENDGGILFTDSPLGVIHTEPFFSDDVEAIYALITHARTYAFLTHSTIGRIPGATFILPHKKHDPGATNSLGMTERELARYCIMPYLKDLSDDG